MELNANEQRGINTHSYIIYCKASRPWFVIFLGQSDWCKRKVSRGWENSQSICIGCWTTNQLFYWLVELRKWIQGTLLWETQLREVGITGKRAVSIQRGSRAGPSYLANQKYAWGTSTSKDNGQGQLDISMFLKGGCWKIIDKDYFKVFCQYSASKMPYY